jgi:hypothetical protein
MPVRSISLFSRRATGALGQAWHHLSAYVGPLHLHFRFQHISFILTDLSKQNFRLEKRELKTENQFKSPFRCRAGAVVSSIRSTLYQVESRTKAHVSESKIHVHLNNGEWVFCIRKLKTRLTTRPGFIRIVLYFVNLKNINNE